jgi:hypothetical protein
MLEQYMCLKGVYVRMLAIALEYERVATLWGRDVGTALARGQRSP